MAGWKGLSLFSGIGGIDLAFEWAGGQVAAMCEIQPYCQKILRKHWPNVPLFEDIKIYEVQMSEQLMLFTEDFHVSPSAWQESKEGKTTAVISGRSFRAWSEKLNRVGLSLKTYLEFCVSQQTTFAATWSVKATRLGYGILKLRLSARNTGENASFLWRTPDAHCNRGASSRERYEMKVHEGMPVSLNDQVAHLLPTPTQFDATCGDLKGKEWNGKNRHSIKLIQAVKLLPTPVANDAKNNGNPSRYTRHTLSLDAVAGGSLNPEWIEWLMGFPIGWTDLEH